MESVNLSIRSKSASAKRQNTEKKITEHNQSCLRKKHKTLSK